MIKKKWSTPDGDQEITYMARVSNPSNQANTMSADKLIGYLIQHSHWSPFEMVNLCVEINTTRDIGRQLIRHWSIKSIDNDDTEFFFQEFSQRYASVEALGEPVYRECRLQDTKNRQNSIETNEEWIANGFLIAQRKVWNEAIREYTAALNLGIAKEQARALLPEGLTPTRMYMNGTLRSWMHFMNARLYTGAQKEIREIAQQVELIVKEAFPLTHSAWSATR